VTSFLHVLTLIDDQSSYGGPTTVALGQCRELIRQGHRAEIVAGWRGAGEPPTHLEGVRVHLFGVRRVIPVGRFSGLLAPSLIPWLRRHARAFDHGHVHLARDLVPLTAARILASARVPYVTQTHGMVVPDRRRSAVLTDRALTLPVLRGATHRLVLTDAEEAGLRGLLGPGVPLTRLPNGIEIPADIIPSEPEVPDVLFLARLHPRKRVLDFVRAAATLIDEGVRATFSIVGPDDGELGALRSVIGSRAALSAGIRYEGALTHAAAVRRMARCSVYVLPSVDEPFPMTLLEALALGRPSICTTTCGIAPVLAEQSAAVVIEEGPAAIAAALRPLVADRGARAELGARATGTAQRAFSISAVAERLLELNGSTLTARTAP
jgi:glycosyltransferase involved in cell wall biosynthesis